MRGLQRLINFYKKVKTWAGNTQLLKRWKYASQKGRLIFCPLLLSPSRKWGHREIEGHLPRYGSLRGPLHLFSPQDAKVVMDSLWCSLSFLFRRSMLTAP